jgi:hypothetical protein
MTAPFRKPERAWRSPIRSSESGVGHARRALGHRRVDGRRNPDPTLDATRASDIAGSENLDGWGQASLNSAALSESGGLELLPNEQIMGNDHGDAASDS